MRIVLLLLLAMTSAIAADDFSPLGEWTMVSSAPLPPNTKAGSGTLTSDPGAMHITISVDHVKTVISVQFEESPNIHENRYDIAEKKFDHWIILVHKETSLTKDGKSGPDNRVTLSREGDKLIMLDSDSRTVLTRWTPEMQKHVDEVGADARIPAPSIADGPVKGTFDGKPWLMTHAMQDDDQMDRKRLDCEILADDLSGIDGTHKQPFLMIPLPLQVGYYTFGKNRQKIEFHPVTFFSPPAMNRMAMSGELMVEVVDEKHMVFAFSARADKDHVVSGHASVVRHPVPNENYLDPPPDK